MCRVPGMASWHGLGCLVSGRVPAVDDGGVRTGRGRGGGEGRGWE